MSSPLRVSPRRPPLSPVRQGPQATFDEPRRGTLRPRPSTAPPKRTPVKPRKACGCGAPVSYTTVSVKLPIPMATPRVHITPPPDDPRGGRKKKKKRKKRKEASLLSVPTTPKVRPEVRRILSAIGERKICRADHTPDCTFQKLPCRFYPHLLPCGQCTQRCRACAGDMVGDPRAIYSNPDCIACRGLCRNQFFRDLAKPGPTAQYARILNPEVITEGYHKIKNPGPNGLYRRPKVYWRYIGNERMKIEEAVPIFPWQVERPRAIVHHGTKDRASLSRNPTRFASPAADHRRRSSG